MENYFSFRMQIRILDNSDFYVLLLQIRERIISDPQFFVTPAMSTKTDTF